MEPTLIEGQGLVGIGSRRARPGQLRVFAHPSFPDFWLVKRVTAVFGRGDDARMIVHSDNATATVADSRTFGPVPVSGSYRVVLRIPVRLM